jgi:hypothetical protein
MTTMKKTTICLSEDDRQQAEALMLAYNLSSLGQLMRFALKQLKTPEPTK